MRTTSLSPTRSDAGFTLIELMIAMVAGLLVLGASTALVVSTFRQTEGNRMREGIERNARFVNEAMQRDLEETGVGIESTNNFGSLSVWADTMAIIRVPYIGAVAAEAHGIVAPAVPGANQGNCGATCLQVAPGASWTIVAGDLARIQRNTVRRLVRVTGVTVSGVNRRVSYGTQTRLVNHFATYAGGVTLGSGTTVQKLALAMYYRDAAGQLFRATQLSATGAPMGEVIATGVDTLRFRLVFTDGDEAATADTTDADDTNDWNDLQGVRIVVVFRSEFTDARVNGGAPLRRRYEWWYAPRNLRYERNRL